MARYCFCESGCKYETYDKSTLDGHFLKYERMTQAQFDALTELREDTLYIITDQPDFNTRLENIEDAVDILDEANELTDKFTLVSDTQVQLLIEKTVITNANVGDIYEIHGTANSVQFVTRYEIVGVNTKSSPCVAILPGTVFGGTALTMNCLYLSYVAGTKKVNAICYKCGVDSQGTYEEQDTNCWLTKIYKVTRGV